MKENNPNNNKTVPKRDKIKNLSQKLQTKIIILFYVS